MYLKNELDFVSGVYKCYGDVDNLKFKVRLEVIKSSMIPLTTVEDQDSSFDPQYCEREEQEFSWNEKVFSDREFELFKVERNCTTHIEGEYHTRIMTLLSDGKSPATRRLFTYTSKDLIPTELHRNVFYDNDKAFLHPCKQKKLDWSNFFETFESKSVSPSQNIVVCNPSDSQKQRNRSLSTDYETMYIVADLSDGSKQSEHENEEYMGYLLFTITWNKRTLTLSVTPDFANFNTLGYKIDVDNPSDTRYVYRYWLSNISSTENRARKNFENFNEEAIMHQNLNLDFELPVENVSHLLSFIELQKIHGFQGDTLFVQYFIHLPSRWSAQNSESLFGITHQSRPRRCNREAFFSCLFEVKLFQEDEETNGQQIDVPQLFFEVGSLDSWKRFRVEGYAWMPLPINSGSHTVVLDSWRPISSDLNHQLRRFFVGADREIADIKYCGLKSECNVFARYGFNTITSGSIHLVVNSVRQTCPATTNSKKMMRSLYSWKTNKLMNNVNNILEAFKKARQRMLSVREPIMVSNELELDNMKM